MIYLVIIKMGGYYVRFYVVGRVLHRAELIDFMVVRDDYYSSRVLAGGPLHAGAVLREPVRLVLVYRYSLLIVEFAHVAIGGLVRYGAYCSSLVNVLLSEYSSHVFVSRGLIFAGEVEVYIRFLVSVKTQERRERYGIAVSVHLCSAHWTRFGRHVYSAVVKLHVSPFQMLALRTDIMGIEGIYFGDSCHGCCQGRTDGTSGAYKVAVF